MDLQTTARTAFAQIMLALPTAVCDAIYNGQTASGLNGTDQSASSLTNNGDQGKQTSVWRCDASKFTRPPDGATIIVAGKTCTVLESHLDPVGAILWIAYMIGKPVTEDAEI